MKKILALLTVVSILTIAPYAFANRIKPTSPLCLEWSDGETYHHLSIKKDGKIYDKGYAIFTYAVTGSDQNGAITGSGYVVRETPILILTYSGMRSNNTISTYQLKYNIRTKSGTIYYRYDDPALSSPVTGSDTVEKTGCQSLDLPPIE